MVVFQDYLGSGGGSINIQNSSSKSKKLPVEGRLTPTQNRVFDCLAVATGITAIYEAVNMNGMITASASRSAVSFLKAVGRRYFFGYIGVALMVRDFYNCYNG
jgi:hypothetical protein